MNIYKILKTKHVFHYQIDNTKNLHVVKMSSIIQKEKKN